MEPQLIQANLAVTDDRGRVAFQRGPLVYCMEQLDQPDHAVAAEGAEGFPRYAAQIGGKTHTQYQPDLLDGVVVLEHPGTLLPAGASALYQAGLPNAAGGQPAALRMIPYYAWSNRQLSAMQVWIPYREA